MKKFFPEYRKMSDLVAERGKEIYSLQNVQAEHILLIETQTAKIRTLQHDLDLSKGMILGLEKQIERYERKKKN